MNDTDIIQKYSKLVYFLALSRTSRQSDAEDVYQEVFLRYIEKKPQFNDEAHAEAWFAAVTANVARDMYRAAKKSKIVDMDEETLGNIASDEDFFGSLERRLTIDEVLRQMNPRFAEALVLKFDCGYTIKEIAEILGESESNVKTLLLRGKRQYRSIAMKGEMKDA